MFLGDAVKHKWKTVRDGYIKYKKQLKQAEESGKKIIDYVWSGQLSFLDNYNVSRKAAPVLNYALQPQVQLFEESNSSQVSPSPSQWETEEEPPAKRKKNIEQGDVDQIMSFISSTKKCSDAVDHLFMSYAETFKKFSPRRQAEMKMELAKLFSTAELNELHDFQTAEELQAGAAHDYNLYAIKAEGTIQQHA